MKDLFLQQFRLLYSSSEQVKDKKRMLWLDGAKGIAILLVMLGHFEYVPFGINAWLSTFHLPLFFIVSGILLYIKKEQDKGWSEIVRKKAKSILIPYIWFTFASAAMVILTIVRGKAEMSALVDIVRQTLTLEGYSVLWFLPVTFLGELFAVFLLKKCGSKAGVVLSIIGSIGGYYGYVFLIELLTKLGMENLLFLPTIKTIEKSFIAAAFMCCGYLLYGLLLQDNKVTGKQPVEKPILEELTMKKQFAWKKMLLGIFLGTLNVAVYRFTGIQDLNGLDLRCMPFYLLFGMTGAMGLLLLCQAGWNIPLLNFMGQNSLIIMCTHMNLHILYYGYRIGEVCNSFLVLGNLVASRCIYTVVFASLLEIPLIIVIHVCFPFVLGKGYRNAARS